MIDAFSFSFCLVFSLGMLLLYYHQHDWLIFRHFSISTLFITVTRRMGWTGKYKKLHWSLFICSLYPIFVVHDCLIYKSLD